MDNLTHSLIGAALARSAPRFIKQGRNNPRLQRAMIFTGILASNAPDGDIALERLFDIGGGRQLYYLLHHRGYTHTLLGALVLALVCAGLGALFSRFGRRGVTVSWRALLPLSLVASFLHILADSWNEYGVHPLSPFYNQWFYGDTIFIVEPLLWCALIPLAFGKVRPWIYALVGFIPILGWARGYVPGIALSWIYGMLFLARALQSTRLRARRLALGWLAVVSVLGVFVVCGSIARERVRSFLSTQAPGERRAQLVLSPGPGNPLCWRVVSAAATDLEVIERIGVVSLAPELLPAAHCMERVRTEHAAPVQTPTLASDRGLDWVTEFRGKRAEFDRLSAESCRFVALLRYARVPFWRDGSIAGDLRYDRDRDGGFATIRLNGEECPRSLPPWTPPFRLDR